MTKIDVDINGHKFSATVKDIVFFLEQIDAQEGTLEESGYAHCIKNNITITEKNGMKWWSPMQPKRVYEAIASC